jgi:hypothetical protein
MKKIYYSLALTFLLSCSSVVPELSASQIKMMTTKQYETGKEMVFKSSISLLQSEGYLIENANTETGLINAYKRIEVSRKLSRKSKATFYVEEFNAALTEVKITFYEGTIAIKNDGYSKRAEEKESMLKTPDIYNSWFNNLRAEIERRKALTK